MSTAYLAVADRARTGRPGGPGAVRADRDRDHSDNPSIRIIGVSRPSALRALLARSITMTALAIERRIRIRLRKPNTEARPLPTLADLHERKAARARHEIHITDAAAAQRLFAIR